jgi:hypothetical protein
MVSMNMLGVDVNLYGFLYGVDELVGCRCEPVWSMSTAMVLMISPVWSEPISVSCILS